jgi:hypothetical protein
VEDEGEWVQDHACHFCLIAVISYSSTAFLYRTKTRFASFDSSSTETYKVELSLSTLINWALAQGPPGSWRVSTHHTIFNKFTIGEFNFCYFSVSFHYITFVIASIFWCGKKKGHIIKDFPLFSNRSRQFPIFF